jgi:putative peptidoglycan lipid II flippase
LAPAAVGCSFVYSALLMSRRRFAFASIHHAAVNLSTVLLAFLLYEHLGSYGFAVGYALGAWLQLAAAYYYVAPLVAGQREDLHTAGAAGKRADAGLLALLSGPAPIMAQALALECNTAVSRAFASTYGPGMTAAFDYGFKLFRVPLALLVVPLSQSLLPEISDMQSATDQRPVVRAMKRAAWLIFGAGLVVMAGFMIFREPLVRLLFQRGEFGADSTRAVAAVLLGYLPVMIGRGLVDLLARTLFGMRKFRTPLVATTVALTLNAVICSLLPPENPVMIGLGASVGFMAAAIILTAYVTRLSRDD